LIVTEVPTDPDVGERLLIVAEVTAKFMPLLARPSTVTTALPDVIPYGTATTMVVAFQLVGVASVPLNVTVLSPCVEPKFVPVIVMVVPTGPELGDKVVMLGVPVLGPKLQNADGLL
jgi:hypothetical protein